MIGEIDIHGVLVSAVLVSALIALAAAFVVRRVFAALRLYRFVWHPALFDVAVFVILWAVVNAAPLRIDL